MHADPNAAIRRLSAEGWSDQAAVRDALVHDGMVASSWCCRACGFHLRRWAPEGVALERAACWNASCVGEVEPWDGLPFTPTRPITRPPKRAPEPL